MAEGAARAAEHLEQKAANARNVAERHAAGATSEEAVASAVAPLTAEGWHVLHDRVTPTGGNIDHIIVGPGSVVVIDAEAWNGELTVRSGRLFNTGAVQPRVGRAVGASDDA